MASEVIREIVRRAVEDPEFLRHVGADPESQALFTVAEAIRARRPDDLLGLRPDVRAGCGEGGATCGVTCAHTCSGGYTMSCGGTCEVTCDYTASTLRR